MSARPSLERRVALWFAATLVVLYGTVGAAIWGAAQRNGRQHAALSLEMEAESIAGYIASRGRIDMPEIAEVEGEPFPIWIRVVSGSMVVAATPGAPDIPPGAPHTTQELLYLRSPGASQPLLVVRHAVGGRGARIAPNLSVEAIGDITLVRLTERRLAAGLSLLGLVVIPVAAFGGRLLARRALAPIADLVRETRALDPADPRRRLGVAPRTVEEVSSLAASFNDVLGRLERSLETMRRFTADASHEIRNPLAVMRTGLEVALRRERPLEEYRTLLRENLEEIRRLQAILEGLLALARVEPGRESVVHRVRVDLTGLVRDTVARFEAAARERGVTLESDLAADLEVSGDPTLLGLIAFNLIDNALKHGPPGAPVRVDLRRAGGSIVLTVADGGPGIRPEHRQRIFERFVRVGAEAAESGVGGLGLAVVRWVAEAHGGNARVLETEAGFGASFEVTLPADR